MSVVAVKIDKDTITIGADSFVGFSHDTQLKDKGVKIFKQNNMIVGGVGYAADIALLKLFSKTHRIIRADEDALLDFIIEFRDWARDKDDKYKQESDFIFVVLGKAFFISSDLYLKEIKDFAAMGAGQNMAQAALLLGTSVKQALEVACELSIYCEKPISLFSVKKAKAT